MWRARQAGVAATAHRRTDRRASGCGGSAGSRRSPGAAAARFLPVAPHGSRTGGAARSAWTERRTLLIGVMVLTFALAEGTANDWISLAHDRRPRHGPVGRCRGLHPLRRRHDHRPAGRPGRPRPPWPGPGAVGGIRGGRGRGPDHRLRGPSPRDRGGRRGLGVGRVPRLPGRHERRRRRAGPGRGPGERRVHDRVRRLPQRASAGRPPRRPGGDAGRVARRRGPDGPRGALTRPPPARCGRRPEGGSPATQVVDRPCSYSRGTGWLATKRPSGSTALRIPDSCRQARSG